MQYKYTGQHCTLMQAKLFEEYVSKVSLAKTYGLVPRSIVEAEFTVDQSGQASTIEYWPTVERQNRYEVDIPQKYRDQFIFSVTATFLSTVEK